MKERILTMLGGISGMGKSYLAKQKLIPLIAQFQPVIILDNRHEYAGKRAKDVPKKWNNHESARDFLQSLAVSGGKFSGVHVIQCYSVSDYDLFIRFFADVELGACLVLDEAHFIFDDKRLSHLADKIKNIARFGRHEDKSLVLITQRFMDVPPDVRSQFTGVISFAQNEPSDVDSLKKKGFSDAQKIIDFKPREFEIFGEIPKTIIEALQ